MKRVLKGVEPGNLLFYRRSSPESSWEVMRNDPHFKGQDAYVDIRIKTHDDQGGICAYCEIDIGDNDSLKSRIEHFHPKSDTSTNHNWALDWSNMVAVCSGGSYKYAKAPHTLEPLNENLSCDSHKDRLIQTGKLSENCEGWILNPLELPAFPGFFDINKSNGELIANDESCDRVSLLNNNHKTTKELIEKTIVVFNLNCDRLCQARLRLIRDIERSKKQQRELGYSAQQGLQNLVTKYFRRTWPAFFTTVFICLGSSADSYLQQLNYQG